MEDVQSQNELIRASKNGVTFTVVFLLDQGTDPNVADEVLVQNRIFFIFIGFDFALINLLIMISILIIVSCVNDQKY